MKFTLRQLEVFSAVAQSGSVSRAAQQLAMSQSATSTALGELEKQFDQPLFDRVGKSLRLNETGELLLPRAVEVLDRAGEIEDLLEGRHGFGPLRIGATLTIGNYLATLVLADYLQRHPDSRARLEVHNTQTIVDQLLHYQLDLGLVEGRCAHPDLHVEPWIDDELAVFCAPSHPLAAQGRANLAELAAQDWIVRESGSGTRDTFDHALRGIDGRLNIRLELEHTEAIKRAVEAGLGIGCISRLALRDAVRRGDLVLIDTPEIDLNRQFNFVWHTQKYPSAGMRELLSLCRALSAGVARSDLIVLPGQAKEKP